jgi:hypothetical protein
MTDPARIVSRFIDLAVFALEGKPLRSGSRAWLQAAMRAYVRGEAGSLDAGPRPAPARSDGRAGAHAPGPARCRPAGGARALSWRHALGAEQEALAAEVRRFQAVLWPRWRDLEAPPAGASRLRSALFHAARSGVEVPESARQLHRIVHGPR